MASAAAASSNYTASASAGTSNYGSATTFNDNKFPKFSEYRSRVMLGDLPQDFLRVQLVQAQIYDPAAYGVRQGYPPMMHPQIQQNPNFLGYFTLTIAEAKLVKGSSLLGLVKTDPYVTFRIGHVSYDTPIASSGGKNPQWKTSYRINLFKGMDKIHLEVYDQRTLTGDALIGEAEVAIPSEVMQGETHQHWYPLIGRQSNTQENLGDILLVMSFMPKPDQDDFPAPGTNQTPVGVSSTDAPVVNPYNSTQMPSNATASSQSNNPNVQQQQSYPQHSPSAIPKPPPPPYSPDDIRAVEEMFPTIDRPVIINLLDKHGGNKDLVANELLQNLA